jgi:hypothetical protein
MYRPFLLVTPVILWQSLSAVCQAQLVQVGPGYVKAPFVRVYSFPNGGSYVKAPFVEVFTPGYYFAPDAAAMQAGTIPGNTGPTDTLPTASQLAEMDWASLAQSLREWSAQLNNDLDQLSTGGDWKTHLKTSDMATLLTTTGDAAPADDVRGQLQEILGRYRAARQSAEAQPVTSLTSFRLVESLLGEYVLPPDVRQRRQLFSAASALSRALGRFETGKAWREYLALSPGMALSQENVAEPRTAQSVAELTTAREQFDIAVRSADMSTITSLPDFALTHQRLMGYLAEGSTSRSAPRSSSSEELPVPRPDVPSGTSRSF